MGVPLDTQAVRLSMRRIFKILVTFGLAAALAFAWWHYTRPKPVEVRVKAAELGLVEETVANTRAGTVKACRRSRLSPSVGGQIAALNVREGDRVKAGAVLLELWNQDLAAQVTLAEREAVAADARARSACLNADNAQREADRQLKLRDRGMASEETVDRAITTAKANHADCEAAKAQARVQEAQVGVSRANLAKTRLQAPFAGIVARVSGELNEYVTPSPPGIPTPPAVDLIDDACFYISAPIDEVDAPRIRMDDTARVSLDAFRDRRFSGKVRRIAPFVLDIEKQARTVEVEVELSEVPENNGLLAGYSADVEVIVDRREDTLRIPTEAVQEENRVLLLDPDTGLLAERRIEPGLHNWDFTEVRSGLKPGDRVVLSLDREGVKDGAAARIEDGSK